jgi:hypothetical protein
MIRIDPVYNTTFTICITNHKDCEVASIEAQCHRIWYLCVVYLM